MPVTATEPKRLSDLLKVVEPTLYNAGYMTKDIVANEAAETDYVVGTLLGKVTASGKYLIWDSTAIDGSEVLAGVVIENKTVPAATDTSVLILARGGAIVGSQAIELNGELLADAVSGLEALNPPIVVADQI